VSDTGYELFSGTIAGGFEDLGYTEGARLSRMYWILWVAIFRNEKSSNTTSLEDVELLQRRLEKALKNAVGVSGIGYEKRRGQPDLKVMVKKTANTKALPTEIEEETETLYEVVDNPKAFRSSETCDSGCSVLAVLHLRALK
jgi:hypothetical protein